MTRFVLPPCEATRMIIRIPGRLCRLALGLCLAATASGTMAASALSPWVGTWGVAQLSNGNANYAGKTLREVVHTSIAGSSVRVQISNEFSDQPLSITDVHVALRSSGSSTQAGSDRQLTFNGQPGVVVPVGQRVSSDGIDFNVPALSDVTVS